MGVVHLCGWQCWGFHSWRRGHFIQIQAVSQHPAKGEDALIVHTLGTRSPPGPHPMPLPAPIQWGTHPCPGTYARLSLPWLSAPSHATRKQDFCLGKPRSSSRSEIRSST